MLLSSYPPLGIPNSLKFFRWSVYIILSNAERFYICAYLPSLSL